MKKWTSLAGLIVILFVLTLTISKPINPQKEGNEMKIWKIALLMSDMKKAEELYVNKLGLKVLERLDLGEQGEALFLDAGNVRLELIPAAAFEGVWGLDRPGVHHLSFKSDDVEGDTADLVKRGIVVKKEPFQPLEGMTLAFFDGLDGVNLQLFNYETEE
jgi:catechol 2,3-dioxygenase-like lactoylglutathione lyase family enzyme